MLALALAVILAQAPSATAVPSPDQRSIVGRMGLEMHESDARHRIAFRPFDPPRRVLAVALLPAFRGDDIRANRGIGYEYADEEGRRFALAQWPANGGSLARFPLLEFPAASCPGARTFARGVKPNGIVWSTPHGLIMTLQANGKNDARTLLSEWSKLIRRGACR